MTSRTYSLTPRADELLRFLQAYIGEHNFAPTYDEMAAGLGLRSKSGIHYLLTQLVERGAVRWMPGMVRTIQLSDAQTFRLSAELAARLAIDAKLCGVTADQRLAELVDSILPLAPAPGNKRRRVDRPVEAHA